VNIAGAGCIRLIDLPKMIATTPKIAVTAEIGRYLDKIKTYRKAPTGQGQFHMQNPEKVKLQIGFRSGFAYNLQNLEMYVNGHPAYPAFLLFYIHIRYIINKNIRAIDLQVNDVRGNTAKEMDAEHGQGNYSREDLNRRIAAKIGPLESKLVNSLNEIDALIDQMLLLFQLSRPDQE
jgi:hypothetical protein